MPTRSGKEYLTRYMKKGVCKTCKINAPQFELDLNKGICGGCARERFDRGPGPSFFIHFQWLPQ